MRVGGVLTVLGLVAFIGGALRRESVRRARGTARDQRLMIGRFSLFPEQASTIAGQVDALYFFLLGDQRASSRC